MLRAGTSATIVRYTDWGEEDAVTVFGSRDLWAEVTAALNWYELHDRPHITRFGISVDRDHQHAWLDDPAHPLEPQTSAGRQTGRSA
ncbi:hypothetical protein ACIPW5_31950 [Streptomyces sp. NPDC090077]|uniref:hypothetical protein n=1 Tax=Streptomyces sp. NPDC090077 TaxID=3365938 RepID=UPI00380C383A